MRPWSSTSIQSETLLRAFAIAAIVWNHANPVPAPDEFGYGGGLTFLMLLSGYNLARFGLQGGDVATFRRACLRLVNLVVWPTLAVVLADWAITGQRPLLGYFFFVSNWYTWQHPDLLQIWYPQMLVKMLLLFWLLSWIGPLARAVLAHPARVLAVGYALAVLLRIVSPDLVDMESTRGRTSNFYLWNVLLGMLAFFVVNGGRPLGTVAGRAGLVVVAAIGAWVAYGTGKLDFWWLTCAMAFWVSVPRVTLPFVFAQSARIVSQAAFTVFLAHLTFMHVWRHLRLPDRDWAQFLFALGGSVALWIVLTAISRAYRAVRNGETGTMPAPVAMAPAQGSMA